MLEKYSTTHVKKIKKKHSFFKQIFLSWKKCLSKQQSIPNTLKHSMFGFLAHKIIFIHKNNSLIL